MEKTEFDSLPDKLKERVRKLYKDSQIVMAAPKDSSQWSEYNGWCEALEAVFGKDNIEEPIRTWNDIRERGLAKDVAVSIYDGIIHNEGVASAFIADILIIAQLMPYYGGWVTMSEWKSDIPKFIIRPTTPVYVYAQDEEGNLVKAPKSDLPEYEIKEVRNACRFQHLAFHTRRQAEDFLKYNEVLVKMFFER